MPHTVLFVVGPPGVGKTSAMLALLGEDYSIFSHPENGAIKWTMACPWAFVGHYGTGTFDGSDTVPYNGAEPCLNHWRDKILAHPDFKYTVLDGDRFSNTKALKFLESFEDVKVICFYLSASDDVLQGRRDERGSDQDPTWLAGRATKARRFADRFKPADTGLFDMFGGDVDDSERENRLTEILVEGVTPSEVARQIREVVIGSR
jgi:DNA polymerase III delta prime subunit